MPKPNGPNAGFVEGWLEQLGLSGYLQAFLDNDIDAGDLAHLTSTDLVELGVTSVGHRRRLLDAIAKLAVDVQRPEPKEKPAPRAPAPRPLSKAERRQVTTMFCDLVGYTRISSDFDPEIVLELLTSYKDACATLIERYGGYVLRYVGDGVLATYGYPRAREDDAARAVATGLMLAEEIGKLVIPNGEQLQVRIGIATGPVVVGDLVGHAAIERDSLVGEAPNLAARLQGEAGAGEVLIAETTAKIIGGQFRLENLGMRSLKGFEAPVTAYRVIGEQRGATRFDAVHGAVSLPMISREHEISRLVDCAAAALLGQGQIVVITGEAGIGKSRLIEEMHRRLEIRPEQRVVLQCSPIHTNRPFHPITHYLDYVTGVEAPDADVRQLDKLDAMLRGLGQASPERLALIAELLRRESSDRRLLLRLAPTEIRERTIAALLDIVEAISRESPIIVIEDVHWADPSTNEWLEQLAGMIRNLPVLLVATMRPDEIPQWARRTGASILHLTRLLPDEIRRLVNTIATERKMPTSVIDAIVGRSDGIPIFAEELARSLRAIGDACPGATDATAIPVTLNEILLARLDLLENGRETAQLAAAIGRDIPLDLMLALSPFGEAAMRESIEGLVESGIFVTRPSGFGDVVDFRHALLRDAAYHLLLRRDRLLVHKLIANTIEARFPAIVDSMPHMLAHQFAEAGDHSAAIIYLERAGRDAARRSAAVEAVAHFTAALEQTSRLPPGGERDVREFDLRLAILGPLIAARGYGADEVEGQIAHAVELSARIGGGERIVPALFLNWIARFNETDVRFEVARQIMQVAAYGSALDKLIAHRCMGTTLLFRGEFAAAIAQFELFQKLFVPERHNEALNKVGATVHAVTVKVGLAEAWTMLGDIERAGIWRKAALDDANASGHYQTICHTTAFAGGLLAALMEDVNDLAFHAARLRDLTLQHDLPYWRPHADLLAGMADIHRGFVEKGFRLAQHGMERMAAERLPSLSAWSVVFAGGCVRAHRPEEGLATLAGIAEEIDIGERWTAGEFHRLRGLLRLQSGDSPGGLEDLAEAQRIATQQGSALVERRVKADRERVAKAS
ncbi:adenylate/guanylate cyclase domain-containing protein [Bradyrhizobium acaciae]|uniref:adenylate/guanylate cyclase domain-containing protein n=1 Tax=Bradyrhizobium acaciae TaxID=2683706 RepID=UPI001E41586A|nr:adenylate/guanylate cyclase domain-containing protein [Bradyrhizobium acaciae]MCC8977317.1 AAA family ATPase [Bradyrhizobium acaciae]